MATVVTTSVAAYDFARKLVDEYNKRKEREKNLNKVKDQKAVPKTEDPRRTVTQINYKKHEDTVKELDRQEKVELYQKKKEEASQWCTLDHEHGPNCRRPVGGCSHDHQKEWAIYEKSTMEKVQAADRFRQEGNEYYRKHNYGLAAVQYRKALLQFDYTFADNEEEEKAVDAVKLPCLLNLAACKCQQEDWDEVLTHCRLALEINPRSVKAYYRTGLAYLARDMFDEAKDAFMSAYEIEPKNVEVLGAFKRLKETIENYKVRRKEVAKEMLSGGASEQATANDEVRQGVDEALSSAASPSQSAKDQKAPEPAEQQISRSGSSSPAAEVAPEDHAGVRGDRASPRNAEPATVPGKAASAQEKDEDDDALDVADRKILNIVLFGAAVLIAFAVALLFREYIGSEVGDQGAVVEL